MWTKRLSRAKWGDRIPHVEKTATGVERWFVDGRENRLDGVADCGAAMSDRTRNPQRWSDVPVSVYDPKERLKAMDKAGIDYAVLYPTVAGSAGQIWADRERMELVAFKLQRLLLEEWRAFSDRFILNALRLFPIDRGQESGAPKEPTEA